MSTNVSISLNDSVYELNMRGLNWLPDGCILVYIPIEQEGCEVQM